MRLLEIIEEGFIKFPTINCKGTMQETGLGEDYSNAILSKKVLPFISVKEVWFPGYKIRKWRCLSRCAPLGTFPRERWPVLFHSGYRRVSPSPFMKVLSRSPLTLVTHRIQGTVVGSVT